MSLKTKYSSFARAFISHHTIPPKPSLFPGIWWKLSLISNKKRNNLACRRIRVLAVLYKAFKQGRQLTQSLLAVRVMPCI
jgi:hypothetical protein